MLKLKLQYFGHLIPRVDSLKKTDAGRDLGAGGEGDVSLSSTQEFRKN